MLDDLGLRRWQVREVADRNFDAKLLQRFELVAVAVIKFALDIQVAVKLASGCGRLADEVLVGLPVVLLERETQVVT